MSFSREKMEKVADSISNKGGIGNACSRCNSRNFTVLEGYYRFEAQDDLHNVSLGGPNIPSYGIICESCGHLDFFAAKIITPEEF